MMQSKSIMHLLIRRSAIGWRLSRCLSSMSMYSESLVERERNNVDEEFSSNKDFDWDNLGFNPVRTDYMYLMKASLKEGFSNGELCQYRNIELSPSSGVINYGQGLIEGLKAYRKKDGSGFLLFRPEENAVRMQQGATRMCMPSPSIDQFVNAVKEIVLANKRWIPPQEKGSLYIRPLLFGSGSVLGVAPALECTFMVYASPVGSYYKDGLSSINLVIKDGIHRATPGGCGGVKAITNYAPGLKAHARAKAEGFTDILFLDSVEQKYLEECISSNIFIVKDNVISTPDARGSILHGITRDSIIDIARDCGYQVEERLVSIEDLMDADETFCTGTAAVVAPVASVTYRGQRSEYKTEGEKVSQKLYRTLTSIQMGLTDNKKGWSIEVN